MQDFVCVPPQLESLFPSVLWKSCNQILLTFKVRFPGDSQSLCPITRLRGTAWGSEPSRQCESFFGVTVLQSVGPPLAGMGFDSVVTVPLLPSLCSSFFISGHGVSLSGGSQHPPVNGCCNFGALRGDECASFYSAVLNLVPLLMF